MIFNIISTINGKNAIIEVNKNEFIKYINFVDNLELGTIRIELGKVTNKYYTFFDDRSYHIRNIKYEYFDEKRYQYVLYAFITIIDDEEFEIYLPRDNFIQDMEELPYV